MTIDEFATKVKAKKATVLSWISKGLIPGAHDDYVPSSARKPYTRTRAKTGEAIIKSILKASNAQMGICAELYDISETDFNTYITGLINYGYISSFEADGVQYYNITAHGVEFLNNNKKIKNADILQAAAAMAAVAVPLLV